SGDMLAAELVTALRAAIEQQPCRATRDNQPLDRSLAPRFFGAGGPRMAAAGVELAVDLTAHAVFGLSEVLRHYRKFKGFFEQLIQLALDRQPDVIILVDYAGFNRRFAAAIQTRVRAGHGPFNNWRPRIVYYVSPQVWASRPGRAETLERDVDLLLSIFPFEQAWYASHARKLRVEFVGHPMIDRHGPDAAAWRHQLTGPSSLPDRRREVLLLPGSRVGEVRRHLPAMLEAAKTVAAQVPARFRLVLPNETLASMARPLLSGLAEVTVQIGGLTDALRVADLAIASSGTVTLECAFFGVPAVVLYKLSWPTYWMARQIVKVPFIAMPNLLAAERVLPELIQADATPENLAREALDLLRNEARRGEVRVKLAQAIGSLGEPGAATRAANAILTIE
ncbi:MAG TPA: lipid-A-disaccharide synthase, partial [Verrucomicrobiae bacterium]|nr:lipid-A-disaccharide synthase [Verrucomicrobiae bacterium]